MARRWLVYRSNLSGEELNTITAKLSGPPAVEEPLRPGQIVEAARYDSQEHHLHPVVVVNSKRTPHICNYLLPQDWLPSSIYSLELVFDRFEYEYNQIQTCEYIPFGTIERYRCSMEAKLWEARSGKLVASYRGNKTEAAIRRHKD